MKGILDCARWPISVKLILKVCLCHWLIWEEVAAHSTLSKSTYLVPKKVMDTVHLNITTTYNAVLNVGDSTSRLKKCGGTGESYDPRILQKPEKYINYGNILCPGHGEGPEVWNVWRNEHWELNLGWVLHYCRNVRPTWVRFTKQVHWVVFVLSSGFWVLSPKGT